MNILGVGLGRSVYMWNANSLKVVKLCDLGADDSVTSVSWIQRVSFSGISGFGGLGNAGTDVVEVVGITCGDRNE